MVILACLTQRSKAKTNTIVIIVSIWDVSGSLKAAARENCRKRIRKVVSGTTLLPGNWADFLKNDENKN